MKFREHHWSMTFLFGWFWNTFYVSSGHCPVTACTIKWKFDAIERDFLVKFFKFLCTIYNVVERQIARTNILAKCTKTAEYDFYSLCTATSQWRKKQGGEATKVRKYQRKTKSTKMTIVFKCKLQHIDCNSQCNKNYFVHKNVNLRQKKRVASREYKTKGHALCPLFLS